MRIDLDIQKAGVCFLSRDSKYKVRLPHFRCCFSGYETTPKASALFLQNRDVKIPIIFNTQKHKHPFIATGLVMAAYLGSLTQKTATLWHVAVESCSTCLSLSVIEGSSRNLGKAFGY